MHKLIKTYGDEIRLAIVATAMVCAMVVLVPVTLFGVVCLAWIVG